jgi:hypothetical protein
MNHLENQKQLKTRSNHTEWLPVEPKHWICSDYLLIYCVAQEERRIALNPESNKPNETLIKLG